MLAAMGMTASCSGEDRSDEQPRVPVVRTISAVVSGDSCIMTGAVEESHNSSLRECGFCYGIKDGGAVVKLKADTLRTFTAVADSLETGEYFYVAYTRNAMGTSYGDTLSFTVN